jgi:hypothetical protein
LIEPTAVHTVAEVHDTSLSQLSGAPGLGSIWELQVVPSQTSASCELALPAPLELPTAAQSLTDAHDTPLRDPPVGLGTLWTDQLVPSHASASVPVVLAWEDPTAMQAVSEVHDTPLSWPPPAGVGVAWVDHVVPFQASASVW